MDLPIAEWAKAALSAGWHPAQLGAAEEALVRNTITAASTRGLTQSVSSRVENMRKGSSYLLILAVIPSPG